MTLRFFLSSLIAGLFLSFATVGAGSAKTSQNYYAAKKQSKKKYTRSRAARRTSRSRRIARSHRIGKLRKVRKSRKVRNYGTVRKSRKNRNYRTIRKSRKARNYSRLGKSRKVNRNRRLRNKKLNARYKNKRKKVTKASLSLGSIKNARHARLTRRGRMSVAKDTRKSTVRNFGKRVSYKYRPGTIVLSNYTRRLYYVVRRGKVISYPIATPRPNEVWSGSTRVSKKKLNPVWYPTPSMREQNPNLPEKVAGGSRANPFGKRALYLGSSLYRIHGTNRPGSIGRSASGGCYRMHNRDISRLWRKVKIGTPVVVLTRKNI